MSEFAGADGRRYRWEKRDDGWWLHVTSIGPGSTFTHADIDLAIAALKEAQAEDAIEWVEWDGGVVRYRATPDGSEGQYLSPSGKWLPGAQLAAFNAGRKAALEQVRELVEAISGLKHQTALHGNFAEQWLETAWVVSADWLERIRSLAEKVKL